MPKLNDFRTDPVLTNVSIAYKNDSFVAEEIFPRIPVDEDQGEIYVYDKAHMREYDDEKAANSKSGSSEIEYGLSKQPYGPLKYRSLKVFVPDQDKKRAKSPLEPRTDATEFVTEAFLLKKERRAISVLTDPAIITQNLTKSTSADRWSDYANSDPLSDIETAVDVVRKNSGKDPNTFIIPRLAWRKLRRHPDLLETVKYTEGGFLTREMMLDILAEYGIQKLIIPATTLNTAKEGQADSLDWMWGKNAWLTYQTPTPGRKTTSFGYTLQLDGGQTVKTHETWDPDGEEIRVEDYYMQYVMAAEAAYAWYNVID